MPIFGVFFKAGFVLHWVKSCEDEALRVTEFCSGSDMSTAGLEGWEEPVEFLLLLLISSSASSYFQDFLEPRQSQSYPMVCVKVDCEETSNFPRFQFPKFGAVQPGEGKVMWRPLSTFQKEAGE